MKKEHSRNPILFFGLLLLASLAGGFCSKVQGQTGTAQPDGDPLQELFQILPLVEPSSIPENDTNAVFFFAGKYIDGQGFGSPYNYSPVRDFGLPVYLLDTNSFIVDDRSLPWSELLAQMQTN